MKTTMYKTYQNSTNPDWQPHIAWREIIHVIIDPILQQQQNNSNEQNDLSQLAAYGDININYSSIGSIPILHTTGEEYIQCINARKNIILKAKRKLPRALSDADKTRPIPRRMSSFDQQQIKDAISNSAGVRINSHGSNSNSSGLGTSGSLTKRSKNFFKNVNRLHWGGKHERHNSTGTTLTQQKQFDKHPSSQTATTGLDESSMPADTISLVSHYIFFLKFMIHDQDRINLC
jgi:hypothetical protein